MISRRFLLSAVNGNIGLFEIDFLIASGGIFVDLHLFPVLDCNAEVEGGHKLVVQDVGVCSQDGAGGVGGLAGAQSFCVDQVALCGFESPGFHRDLVDVAMGGCGGEGELQAGFGCGIHHAGGPGSCEVSRATRLDFHLDFGFINDFYIGVEGEGEDCVGVCLEGQGLQYGRYDAYGEGFFV